MEKKEIRDIEIEILKQRNNALFEQVRILRDATIGCWKKINYLKEQLNDKRRKVSTIEQGS